MANRKIIFLDIDGPLNTGRGDYMNPELYGHHFDDEAVNNLRKLIEQSGADIVLSSSWRHMGLTRIKELWREWGLPGKILGCTPGSWGEERTFGRRGEEIRKWLSDNATRPYSYVIIDDMGPEEAVDSQESHWITVNPHTGISKENVVKAIEILFGQETKTDNENK